ncbi:MAG: hypothetical protein FK734_03320 [Asgard group archaeon]|nr:hypothetical protein [Asgard group archaeon]
MKYSLTKKVNTKSLGELYLMLSDAMEEKIPDIIWEGSEFEVNLDHPDLVCNVDYISTKKGGEFSIKVSWITPAAKKQKAAEAAAKTKEKIDKKSPSSKGSSSTKPKEEEGAGLELVSDEELWLEDEDNWEMDEDEDWDSEDFDDEW